MLHQPPHAAYAEEIVDHLRILNSRFTLDVARRRDLHHPRRPTRQPCLRREPMLTLKIAFRNIFRNTRRSITTLMTIAIGATAVLVFGAYITYIQYGVQTSAVTGTGHLQVFRNGYFNYGTAAPAACGIDRCHDGSRPLPADPKMNQIMSPRSTTP